MNSIDGSKELAAPLQAQWIPFAVLAILLGGNVLVSLTLGLGDAEALYYAYSRHLDWSYLDHPPLVGWMIYGATALFGHAVIAVRVVSMVCVTLTLVFLHLTAKELYGPRGARLVWPLMLAMPMFSIGGVAVTPDAPLMVLWSAVCWLLVRLRNERTGSGGFSISISIVGGLVGLGIGAAFLAKYTGILLVVPALYVVWRKREVLGPGKPVFWIAVAMLLVAVSPVLYWNWTHDFAGLLHRLSWTQGEAGFSFRNLGALVGGQAGYVGPFLLMLLFFAARSAYRARREDPRAFVLLIVSLPTLAVTYLLCLWSPVAEPHWPAPGYLGLMVLLAGSIANQKSGWLLKATLSFGFVVLAIGHLVVITPLMPRLLSDELYTPEYDLANELRGWDQVAELIVAGGEERPVVAAHYTQCSQLAFALEGHDGYPVRCVSKEIDDFDLWHGPFVLGAQGALFVTDNRFGHRPEDFLPEARVARPPLQLEIHRGGRRVRVFSLYMVGPAEQNDDK